MQLVLLHRNEPDGDPDRFIIFVIYIFLRYKNPTALKLVLDFKSPYKFWGFRITYRLPVGLPLLRKRPIKNIVQIDYPRVSPVGTSYMIPIMYRDIDSYLALLCTWVSWLT